MKQKLKILANQKILRILTLFYLFLFFSTSFFCATSSQVTHLSEKKLTPVRSKEAKLIIKSIKKYNSERAQTIKAKFNLTSNLNNKYFKFSGQLEYSLPQKRLFLNLVDFIFKSPILSLFQEEQNLKIHLPKEEAVVLDDVNRFSYFNHLPVKINSKVIYQLLINKIPTFSKQSKKFFSQKQDWLIMTVEDEKNITKMFFKKKSKDFFPKEITLIDKEGNYLTNVIISKNKKNLKKIEIISENQNFRAEINFKKFWLNRPLKVKKFNKNNLSPNTEFLIF